MAFTFKQYTPETLQPTGYNYHLTFRREPKDMNLTLDELKKAYIFTAETKNGQVVFLNEPFELTFRQYGPIPLAFKSYEANIKKQDYINLSKYLVNHEQFNMSEESIEHTLRDINERHLPLERDQFTAEGYARKLTRMAQFISSRIKDFEIVRFGTMPVKELIQVFDKNSKAKL